MSEVESQLSELATKLEKSIESVCVESCLVNS